MRTTRRRLLQGGAAIGLGSLAVSIVPDLARAGRLLAPGRPLDLSSGTVVAVFNAGSGSQELGIRSLPGLTPGGPQAICARADGSLAILDTMNRRVAIVQGSAITSTAPLPGTLDPIDIREVGGDLVVLDPASEQLLQMSATGITRTAIPHGRRSRVARLAPGRVPGTVGVIEEDAASSDYQLNAGPDQAPAANGTFSDGGSGSISVQYPATTPADRRTATVRVNAAPSFVVSTGNPLGSVVPLGADRAGLVYLLITELINTSDGGGLDVDVTVRRYRPDGTFLAMARVPVRGRWSQPRSAVATALNGDAFAIVPEQTRTTILRLNWSTTVTSLTARTRLVPENVGLAAALTTIPNTRAQATAKAQSFYNYQWTATAEMISRACGDSLLPSYITGAGTYFEIPYCWGAFDEPGAYVLRINAPYNYTLGDAHGVVGVSWRGCTAGADCSGFIQQCWGIGPPKQDTETLLEWVTNAPGQSQNVGGTLYPGDMWRLPNTHVRLHYSYPGDGTGDYMYESSIDWGERVWFAFRPWADYPNYLWCLGNFLS
ncbi:MAG: hypothetical protein KGJ98_14375 [Chloroflexota bacterium]|nr:hypothetical protein [Chloroflexota bacterium]